MNTEQVNLAGRAFKIFGEFSVTASMEFPPFVPDRIKRDCFGIETLNQSVAGRLSGRRENREMEIFMMDATSAPIAEFALSLPSVPPSSSPSLHTRAPRSALPNVAIWQIRDRQ